MRIAKSIGLFLLATYFIAQGQLATVNGVLSPWWWSIIHTFAGFVCINRGIAPWVSPSAPK